MDVPARQAASTYENRRSRILAGKPDFPTDSCFWSPGQPPGFFGERPDGASALGAPFDAQSCEGDAFREAGGRGTNGSDRHGREIRQFFE